MRRAVSAGMLVLALCLPASATKLSGPEVRDMVVTGTVFLETGFGDFPLRYDQAGRVTGDGTALGCIRAITAVASVTRQPDRSVCVAVRFQVLMQNVCVGLPSFCPDVHTTKLNQPDGGLHLR